MDYTDYVKRAQSGDRDAFLYLYQMYKDRLYRYAWYRLGNEEDAMDAVSDTVVSALEQIRSLRSARAFSTWLFRIHSASCSRYLKSVIAARQQESIDDKDITFDYDYSLSLELREALDRLDDNEREIVLLSVVAGLTSREISAVTSYTAGSVRSKQSRALAKMKEFLG